MLLNAVEVMKRLPHRYPFLLVDGIESFTENESIVGIKNVSVNEPFFQGHFPGHPVMPGVLIIESMAQVGGVFASLNDGVGDDKVTYFTGIDRVKFRQPVVPGDVLRMELTLRKRRHGIYHFLGKAYVGDTLVTEAELKATFVNREE
jgi:3-hydroxyacyl-[acyl-carrier-protein] dehydratase